MNNLNQNKYKVISLAVIIVVAIIAGLAFYYHNRVFVTPNPVLENNVTFDFPATLPTKYIHTADWPPKVSVNDGPFACTSAGSPIIPAGQTTQKIINGRTYCVTVESEGAAGTVYNQYAYAFPKNDKVIILTFSLGLPQCDNYDDPQKTGCKNERATFNIDNFIDTIVQTAQFTNFKQFGEPIYGNLNNDGLADQAVWLTDSPGGSGTFYYAELLINTGSGYKATNAILLGDRIAPQNINIQNGRAVYNFAERKANEPFTTPPSVGKSVWVNYDSKTNQISEVAN